MSVIRFTASFSWPGDEIGGGEEILVCDWLECGCWARLIDKQGSQTVSEFLQYMRTERTCTVFDSSGNGTDEPDDADFEGRGPVDEHGIHKYHVCESHLEATVEAIDEARHKAGELAVKEHYLAVIGDLIDELEVPELCGYESNSPTSRFAGFSRRA